MEYEVEKKKWGALLTIMVADYRKNKPDSLLTDRDILQNIMVSFEKTGFISRRADGKWVIPKLQI